jgi:acetyltransferase-like isoleucine patch superfamily enzyme
LLRFEFAEFGSGSTVVPPADIRGFGGISIGRNSYIGPGALLYALGAEKFEKPLLRIGEGVRITGGCTLSAVESVIIEDFAMLARNVYVSDHSHKFDRTDLPIAQQGLANIAPARVGIGAWLAQNVVICPGVTVGRGSVIGANSVVKQSIPDFVVAAGAPATVRRQIIGSAGVGI